MIDPLTAIGGLAAVLQLSSAAAKVVDALCKFAEDARFARAEIQRFAGQVRTFCHIITIARNNLRRYCREFSKSPLVKYISKHNVLDSICSEAAAVEQHIWDIDLEVAKLESQSALWASIKWVFKRSSILELSPEMQSLMASLNLLQSTAMLDAALRSGKDSRREARSLRREIKSLVKTVDQSQLQLSNRRQRAERPPDLNYVRHDALIELAESMRKHNTVPESPGSSSPLSSSNDFGAPQIPPGSNSKVLHVRAEDLTESVTGWVREPTGTFRGTTAYLAENLDGNIISASRASELGFDIVEPPPGRDDGGGGQVTFFQFDDAGESPVRSIGRAVIHWRKFQHHDARYPTLTLTCDVCENTSVGLILGRPFLEEMARQWRKRVPSANVSNFGFFFQ
ncbi:uncharacterized protein B0T15DRAFT_572631 [Chaetomium strumarium]|uniref:Fungal N-terminal domain-containing protein n=1 Tax=Chaetomium strumarium TaxID=1170767 RepID=A0AAJ0M4G9_9PEZI|nr:hypothetical protein B0T15DRAFT_572631 [Chaetomium strumarium]